MDLGYQVIKTKAQPYWHKKDETPIAGVKLELPGGKEDKDEQTHEKTDYPVFAIDDAPKELYDYPDEGECVIKYKIVRRAKTEKEDEEPRHSIEMDIMSIEPVRKEAPKRKSAEERTRESVDAYNRASRK